MPPEHEFVPVDASGWSAHPAAPDWLLKPEDRVYVHTPSGSLWRRHGVELVAEEFFRCVAVGSFSGTSPRLLLRAAWSAWAHEASESRLWRDGGVETTVESPVPRPALRIAARGLRRTRHGVSPPPDTGWSEASEGWQCHPAAQNWLRKQTDAEGHVFFYLPNESLWMQLRPGAFVCVDTYHEALAAFISAASGTLLKTCLLSWRSQASVVGAWRKRIRVMKAAAAGGAAEGPEEEEAREEVSPFFPVQTAFLSPSVRARSSGPPVRRRD